jgi:type III secretion system FlhB-like substrate exporter
MTMTFATYTGPNETRELWGVTFTKDVPHEVPPQLAAKCRGMVAEFVVDEKAIAIEIDNDEKQVAALGSAAVQSEAPSEPATGLAPRKRGRPRKVAADGNL